MKLRLYQIDAFTSRLFRGNPAAVCPLDTWLDDRTSQSIAAENNLSETAFFVDQGKGYEIRWFTPEKEVDLCGHATLASGYVLLQFLRPDLHMVRFSSMSGDLTVARRDNLFCLDFPSRPGKTVPCPEILQEALGLEPRETLLSKRDYLVVLDSEESVRSLRPNVPLFTELESEGVIVTAPGRDCDFVCRCFFPKLGVPEDPVTGSAQCTLVPYWADRIHKSSLFCRQVSLRGGELWCELRGDRVEIAGECALYMEGEIHLDTER